MFPRFSWPVFIILTLINVAYINGKLALLATVEQADWETMVVALFFVPIVGQFPHLSFCESSIWQLVSKSIFKNVRRKRNLTLRINDPDRQGGGMWDLIKSSVEVGRSLWKVLPFILIFLVASAMAELLLPLSNEAHFVIATTITALAIFSYLTK